MTERFRFFDALTYGIRTLFWRPVRALAYIAVISLLSYGYYAWMQSDAGMEFFAGYLQSTQDMVQGDFGSYGGDFALLMGGSIIYSCIMIAGAYRVYVRDEPVLRLPLQLGFDELRTFGVYLLVLLLSLVIMLLGTIVLSIVIGILAFIAVQLGLNFGSAGGSQGAAAAFILGLLISVPLMLFYVYAGGRLMVGLALTIRDRRFRLGGWKASKGAGMQLLWAHILLYLVMIGLTILLSPGLVEIVTLAMTDPAAMQDPDVMMAMSTNPYGDLIWLAIPVQLALTFLLFGPTAAVANWDARKRAAAEAPSPTVPPVAGPAKTEPAKAASAEGVGTGEAGD